MIAAVKLLSGALLVPGKSAGLATFKLTSMEVPRCWYHYGRAQRRHACVLEAAYHGLAWLTFAGFSQVTYASGHKPLCETGLCSALDRVARASVTLEIKRLVILEIKPLVIHEIKADEARAVVKFTGVIALVEPGVRHL